MRVKVGDEANAVVELTVAEVESLRERKVLSWVGPDGTRVTILAVVEHEREGLARLLPFLRRRG